MCTHAFHASAWGTFERLGILEAVESAGARRGGLNIWSRYGWISPSRAYADRHRPRRRTTSTSARETFDPMLRELAAGTDGVELTLGSTADLAAARGQASERRRRP